MDLWILQVVNQLLIHPTLDSVMMVLTIGSVVAFPLFAWRLIGTRQPRLGWTLLAALGASLLLTLIFYYLALRPRPTDVRLLLPTPPFPSYPSGHTAMSFALVVVLALALRRWWVTGVALLIAVAVSLSRLYLGHHYPSDVVGGLVLGCAIGASTYGMSYGGQSLVARLQWLVWTQIAIVFLGTQMAYLDLLPNGLLRWPYADKVLHASLFGAVVFWLNLWLLDRRVTYRGWAIPLAILIPFTLALLEEGLQAFSPLRSADVTDLASDLFGMLCCWWLSRQLLLREQAIPPLGTPDNLPA